MANPGYPQMGQMPPMGGAPMGPPMGAPPMMQMQRPVRRGTSKAVPVVVSAGLAVGVFCGLLFGVGTGKDEAAAAPAKGNNVKGEKEAEEPKTEPGAAPKGIGATAAAPVPAGSGSAAKPPAGSGAVAAAGSGAGSAVAPAVPEIKKVKLTITVKPEAAAKEAKITVDGTEIVGLTTEVLAEKKTVKVGVKANGFHSKEQKIELVGDEMGVEIELAKKSSGGGVHPPKRPDKPPGGGGGLIDI